MRKFVLLTILMSLMTGLMALGCGGGGSSSSAPFLETFTGSQDSSQIDTTGAVSLALEAGFAGLDAFEYVDDTPDLSVGGESTALSLYGDIETLAVPNGSDCSTTTESGSHGGTLESGICITPAEDLLFYGDATDFATTTEYWDGYFELVTDFVSEGQYSFESYSYANSTGDDYFIDGTIKFSELGSTGTINYNLVVIDNSGDGQEMGYLREYKLVAINHTTYEEVTITGRYYHNDDGYVDVSTPEPLLILINEENPYDGILRFTGAEGNYIEIEFGYMEDPNQYQVTVEILGDEISPNWSSGVLTWVSPG